MHVINPNLIVDVPLSQIEADFEWNSRSGRWTVDSGDEDNNDFSDFVQSFEGPDGTIRQDTPVELKVQVDKEKPYFLVKGYRRFKALQVLATKLSIAEPTIRAIVSELTPLEARFNNLSENVTRQNISAADFAWGVWQLRQESRKHGPVLTGLAIAKRLGRSSGHIDRLLSIMRNCKVGITRRWRQLPIAVSTSDMYAISKLPTEEQDAAFAALLSSIEGKKDGNAKSQLTWFDNAKRRGRELGTTLGTLEREGLIDTSGLDFDTHLDLLIKVKETASAKDRGALAVQMHKAYLEAKEMRDLPDSLAEDGDKTDD